LVVGKGDGQPLKRMAQPTQRQAFPRIPTQLISPMLKVNIMLLSLA
jgi:hypothetical protein